MQNARFIESKGGVRINCWTGWPDWGAPENRVSDSSECRGDNNWNPHLAGTNFKYNGGVLRSAVYRVNAPARFMGCHRNDDDQRTFNTVIQGLSASEIMETCAAAALAKGSAWYASRPLLLSAS